MAFFSLDPGDIDKLDKDEKKSDALILNLRAHPQKLLATILIGNNFVNIGIILCSDFILRKLLPETTFSDWSAWLHQYINVDPYWIYRGLNFFITIIGVTFVLVLFGEILPKVYANINNLAFARFMSRPMHVLFKGLGFISSRLVGTSHYLEQKFKDNSTISDEQKDHLDKAIDFSVSQDIYGNEEAEILKGILNFGDVAVKQIMKSRVDMKVLDREMDFNEIMQNIREFGFSRFPVFEEELDNIIGLLYIKDLLGKTQKGKEYPWQEHIRYNVLYVPESKKIDDLLKEIQEKRLHMAIVVDEFGGTSGLVTLEDIMEEVIGEIKDEFDDDEEKDYIRIDQKNYIFEGKVLLNDVCRIIGEDKDYFDEARGLSDSLAGLLLEMKGRIPNKDEELSYKKYEFKVVSVSKRRIEKINLHIREDEEHV